MRFLIRVLAIILAGFLVAPVQASVAGSHTHIMGEDPEWQQAGWRYGCTLHNATWTEIINGEVFLVNECYVDAPAGSPVTSFGVDFSANGWSHWDPGTATYDNTANSGNWNYTGETNEFKQIKYRVGNSTSGARYWDTNNFIFNFWYISPGTVGQYYVAYGSSYLYYVYRNGAY